MLCFPLTPAGAPSTPAEVARGPSRDDPLEDPAAPTWVDGYNRSLGQPTVNAADGAPRLCRTAMTQFARQRCWLPTTD